VTPEQETPLSNPSHRFLIAAAVSLSLSLGACGGPKSVVLPDDLNPQTMTGSREARTELQEAVQALSEEERGLLLGYVMRRELGKSGLGGLVGSAPVVPESGVTVGKAIDLQRAWVAEREIREAQEKAMVKAAAGARESQMAVLRDAVFVNVAAKKTLPQNFEARRYSDEVHFEVGFGNQTGKPVAGVKGTLVFSDLFGDEFKRVNISYDDGIGIDAVALWKGYVDLNQFNAGDKKLAATDLDKMHVVWEPKAVVFADKATAPLTADALPKQLP
jgi:hypothetical protein